MATADTAQLHRLSREFGRHSAQPPDITLWVHRGWEQDTWKRASGCVRSYLAIKIALFCTLTCLPGLLLFTVAMNLMTACLQIIYEPLVNCGTIDFSLNRSAVLVLVCTPPVTFMSTGSVFPHFTLSPTPFKSAFRCTFLNAVACLAPHTCSPAAHLLCSRSCCQAGVGIRRSAVGRSPSGRPATVS